MIFKQKKMKLFISNTKYALLATGMVLLFFATSCEKYVDTKTPPNSIGLGEAFSDSSTATAAVMGIYSGIASGSSSFVFNVIKYGAMSSDVGFYNNNTNYDDFKNNTLSAGNAANGFWQDAYGRLGRVNYAIEGLTASTTLSQSVKNQLLGEAKFWRAFIYFYLVNYFGPVPLVTSTDYLTTSQLQRVPETEVYGQIVKDLTEAKALLTESYPSAERARINKNVVSAFLSRVYFYRQNWDLAEAEATAVIDYGNNSGTYGIVQDLNQVFKSSSKEIIWQISLAGNLTTPATVIGAEFIPLGNTPTFVLYDTLVNSFQPDDKRKADWTGSVVSSGTTFYYPYKYKLRTASASDEYVVMIRLAEIYLNRAEARANQNNLAGAIEDIRVVQGRAGVALLPLTATKDEILAALEHERWVELFTEFGDRWFNLKRLNKAKEMFQITKPLWEGDEKQLWYPVPTQGNQNLDFCPYC